ncbi:MAG: hypothetical protein NTY65_01980 [Planctomycetota bacterium]|nr:hypothetical protein [Planctomycetota bacterium]
MADEKTMTTKAGRFPPWLRKRIPAGGEAAEVRRLLAELGLATVCSGAHCPNMPEQVVIEVLTPDFRGSRDCVETVLAAGPDIFNHNVETVPRLYPTVRPEADYRRSLAVLAHAKSRATGGMPTPPLRGHASAVDVTACPANDALGMPPASPLQGQESRIYTKSGLMLGLGEAAGEVRACLADLRAAGCDIVTIGQYLSPSPGHHPVARFVEPGEFAAWEAEARAMGFAAAACGPFVRSSYQAESVFANREL